MEGCEIVKDDKIQLLQEIELTAEFDLISLDETGVKHFSEVHYEGFNQSRKEAKTVVDQFTVVYDRLVAKHVELAPRTVKLCRQKPSKKVAISKFTRKGRPRLLLIGADHEMQVMTYQGHRELQRRKLFRHIQQSIIASFQDVDTLFYEFSQAAEQLPLLLGQGVSLTYIQTYEEKIHSRIIYINHLFEQLNDYVLCFYELMAAEWQIYTEIQQGCGASKQRARLEDERCFRYYRRIERQRAPLQVLIEQLLLSASEVSNGIKKMMTQATMARAAEEVAAPKAKLQADRQERLMREVTQEDEFAEEVTFEADQEQTAAFKVFGGDTVAFSAKDEGCTEKIVPLKLEKPILLVGAILAVFFLLYFLYK